MTEISYTAFDLARHELDVGAIAVDSPILEVLDRMRDGTTVAEVVVETCAVGFGGHYDEVMEDDSEGEVLAALADHLGPLYSMTPHDALALLEHVRTQWVHRLQDARNDALEAWRRQGWYTELHPTDLDHCPACGRKITDFSEGGCEAPDGQRYCLDHGLDALGVLRGATP